MTTDSQAARTPLAVLFDLDGTLADCFEDIQAALNSALAAEGFPQHDLETVTSFVGNGIERLVRAALPEPDRTNDAMVSRCVARMGEFYANDPAGRSRLYPLMSDILNALYRRGVKLGVVTNKPHELAVQVLERLGILAMIHGVQGEEPGLPPKPSPAMLFRLLTELRVPRSRAHDVVLVGDGAQDIAAARAAGIRAFAVAWGMTKADRLREMNPDAVLSTGEELALALGLRVD